MKNRIFINASILHEKPTGLGVYAHNVIKHLNTKDKDMKIFCPVDIDDIKTNKITKYVKPEYKKWGGVMRLLWTQLVLPFKVKKDDVIYHPFQYLSLLSKSKQIITIHDFIPLYYPEVAKHQCAYYKYLMPVLLKRAYKIVCISENTKKDIQKFYKVDESKIVVIYNGYDEELFNEKNKDREKLKKYNINYDYLVMVGASYPHKNLDAAIKGFKTIADKTDCNLVIVGKDSPYIVKLKALAKELGIEDRVKFVGYVSNEDLATLYGYAKAFVYPTLYEGFGLPILEAMGCGTAVLCANNSSLPEVSRGTALIFDEKNVNDIGEKMLTIINDEALRSELIEKSKENIKDFSWKKTADEVYKLIND